MTKDEAIRQLQELGQSFDPFTAAQKRETCMEVGAFIEQQAKELSYIDAILDRRPALANFDTRAAKIEHAINTAKKVDQQAKRLNTLRCAMAESKTTLGNALEKDAASDS